MSALSLESNSAMVPHALGLDMEVPFISMLLSRVHVGTGEIAPPGAMSDTPRSPMGFKMAALIRFASTNCTTNTNLAPL